MADAPPDDRSGFTGRLREAHHELFERAARHRFMREMSAGSLEPATFARYLVQEHAFVTTAVQVNGFALAKAPHAEGRRRLARAVFELTTTQESYFRRLFDELGVAPESRENPTLPAGVRAFQDFFLRVAATGAYEEILTTVLGAEWLYATWCGRAAADPPDDPRFRRWIDIHVDEPFAEHVRWLRGELDGPAADDARRAALGPLFRRTLELEIAFHDAVYAPTG